MSSSHHHRKPAESDLNTAFLIGIGLNLAYVSLQLIVGWHIDSLSLLSDAGHNFLDVGGLSLSLLAFKLTKFKANESYTYGFKKSSILISLLNAIILLISIGAIGYEAIMRIGQPSMIPGKTIAIIALIGIFINGGSAFLFFQNKENDINIKTAFLHLLSDALISVGLVIGGVFIHFTHIYWIDPLLSIIICIVIIFSTWSLLKDSLKMSLDGVPENIDLVKVKQIAKSMDGVLDFHHIHIWAVSTTENALTGHLVLDSSLSNIQINQIKEKLRKQFIELNISHCTLETELNTEVCTTPNCLST